MLSYYEQVHTLQDGSLTFWAGMNWFRALWRAGGSRLAFVHYKTRSNGCCIVRNRRRRPHGSVSAPSGWQRTNRSLQLDLTDSNTPALSRLPLSTTPPPLAAKRYGPLSYIISTFQCYEGFRAGLWAT